ncbi:MAG: phosphodiesterase [Clostridia bacterium]|jgi:putative phosphoesterase|nr:phosphodiesterase [Clostridia bacterium]
MKFLIASDLHGSSYYAQKIVEQAKTQEADKIILLGDVYNHGPRNPLPTEYNPIKVAQILNDVKQDLMVIKGNCDSQVDTLISEFDFIENACLISGGKTFYLTHGHVNNIDVPTKTKFDYVVYGHFHTGFIKEKNGTIYVNAGSVSLPKNGTKSSYLTLQDGKIKLFDIEGNLLQE